VNYEWEDWVWVILAAIFWCIVGWAVMLSTGCASPCATLTPEEVRAHQEGGASVVLTPCHWSAYYNPVNCLAGSVSKQLNEESK